MTNRIAEINSIDKDMFRALYKDLCNKPAFARLFNWGPGVLNKEETDCIKGTLASNGVRSPITNEELDLICGAICSRSVKLL